MRKLLITIACIVAAMFIGASQAELPHDTKYEPHGYSGVGPSPQAARIYMDFGHSLDIFFQTLCNQVYEGRTIGRYFKTLTREALQDLGYTHKECEIKTLVTLGEWMWVKNHYPATQSWEREYPYFSDDVRNFGRHFEHVLRCHQALDQETVPTPGFAQTFAIAVAEFKAGIVHTAACAPDEPEVPASTTTFPAASTATQ